MLNLQTLKNASNYSKIWIAYSGGIDSHVLLHLFSQLRLLHSTLSLQAVHIHHGLSPNADAWALHCQHECDALNIPLKIVKVQLTRQADLGIEAAAREERYRVFSDLLEEHSVLVTAHHANDQAETVLLQLLRGAGPKGLAAMPVTKVLGKGSMWRPLLSTSRAEIEQYAKAQQLQWIEDESNVVEDYSRNFLRQQIMPKLQEQWPSNLITLARSAAHCAEASDLLEDLAREDLSKVQAEDPAQLQLEVLKKLSKERQRNALRCWFKALGFALPETRHLQELQEQILTAEQDAMPLITWANVECRRFNQKLYVMHPQLSLSKKCFAWPEEKEVLQAELSAEKYQWIEAALRKLSSEIKKDDKISIRFRVGGETCKIEGRQGTHELKKLFQEWKVPPWERDRAPLVYINEALKLIFY